MGIYYLEVNKKGQSTTNLDIKAKYNLQQSFLYKKENIYFVYFTNINQQRPFILEDESKVLVVHGHSFNVTLYNYRNIDSLFGNFNIITIYKKENKVDFVKDYSNSFDSFLFQNKEKIIITNNPLLIHRKNLNIDYLSIAQYLLHFSGFFSGNYFYKEVCRIKPGALISLQSDFSLKIEKNKPKIRKPSFISFHNSFNEIITKSIKSTSYENYAVDLTGGYDTRLITSCFLKNNIDFISVVYGEDDEEVKYVKQISDKLNLKLRVVKIQNDIDSILKQWPTFFFLSGGYYNLFEVLKEGGRCNKRTQFSLTKVAGAMGEVLRDKWYLNVFHKSFLTQDQDALSEIFMQRLLKMKEPMEYCTKQFISSYIDRYRALLKSEAHEYVYFNDELDISQKFISFMFTHYAQGWLGCLYNFHNNIVSVIAPYMDNYFYLNCLYVDANFRQNASGMTSSINKFYPEFKEIPFIDGQKCSALMGLNLLRYLSNKFATEMRRRLFGYTQKKDYNHSFWLRILLTDSEFRSKIEQSSQKFNYIISPDQFQALVKQGLNNQLNRRQYDFIWKLISLKLTLNYD